MKNFSLRILGLSGAIVFLTSPSFALPNSGSETTFLGPIVHVGVADLLSSSQAYSLAAEASVKNIRLNGSYAWLLCQDQQFKLSAEYLLQNITYSYFSGNTAQWVQQGDISANYQYTFSEYMYLYHPQFAMNAFVSHSPGKSLRVDTGSFVNKTGVTTFFIDNKRIAGSTAGGISPGFMLAPWSGGNVGLYLNYDRVNYDTDYISNQNVNGFGGTAQLKQALADNVEGGLSAGIRSPFNNYNAHVTWLNLPLYGLWAVGVNGAYTAGKNRLPSTYSVGLSFDYLINQTCLSSETQKQEAINFLNSVSKPAVYMPQVLAIPDEHVTTFSGL